MGSKMLIDATHAEETRVVVVRGNRIEEFDFESAARKQLKGNIYLAKVTRVEPSLQAAFIEYGGNRHGFLAFSEIHPDYYQIPVADRQALLREQEEEEAALAAEEAEEDLREAAAAAAAGASQDHPHEDGVEDLEHHGGEHHHDEDAHDDHHHGDDIHHDGADHSDGHQTENPASGDENRNHAPAISRALDMPSPHISEAVESSDEAETLAETDGVQVEHGIPNAMGDGVEVVGDEGESHHIESIGAEDALEEVSRQPRRNARRQPRRQYKIQEVIKRRQIILVQVVKEERGNKGAALTTYLSLAGRYCVLMPNTARGGGISRKITDAGDRRRLKEVARDVEVPKGMGLIVRTAGAQRTRPEIKRDFDYLMRLWENVRDLTLHSTAPALVYEEGSLIKRSIRDLYTKDVDEVFVEGDDAYREAKDFMKMLMPSHAKNVKQYKDTRPLFSKHQVETQLDALYSPNITLPSGGYLVMNQTEALVAIDINSGKATREHNIEDTAYKTNLEACDEIARQLRLRDLAGLVVIDFIDMEENRNNRGVERRLKEALKNDRARIQVGRISHFGLMEMSRQRLRPGLLEGSSRPCPHCEGRGVVRSVSSSALSVLRTIEDHLMSRKAESITVKCSREAAFYILNEKRDNLLAIEQTYGVSVFIVASDEIKGSQVFIERAPDRAMPQRRALAQAQRNENMHHDVDIEDDTAEDARDAEVDEVAASDDESTADSGEGQRGKRRRRGRRGGRRNGRDDAVNGDDNAVAGASAGDAEISATDDEAPQVEMQQKPRRPAKQARQRDGEAVASEAANETFAAPDHQADGAEEPEGDVTEREKPARRRDRWGRQRKPRPPRGEMADTESPFQAETPAASEPQERAKEPQAVRREEQRPAAAPIIEVLSKPVEVRKWQPPKPTIAADEAAPVRKGGWWSKRS